MKIIERIEIHRFRSIGDESILTSDINVYSGVNNSGKSNILRALNLFFNQETSYDSPFNFKKDYNKAYTGRAGGAREIKITLHFAPRGKAALSSPFSISRSFRLGQVGVETKYQSTDESVQQLIDSDNGKVRRQFTIFLNSLKYFYIPAVRDKRFVRHLFLNFEQIVTDKRGEDLEEKLKGLSDIITDRSEAISKDFEQFLKLPTKAAISSELSDILGTIQVSVDSGLQILKKSKQKGEKSQLTSVFIDLFSSGDGVLMSYLAYFLAHLCRETPNIRYIWGFEEPENSLEYSKVQKLAEEFIGKFNSYAQIFLTTHSPAFVNLKNEEGVSFYRAYIEPNGDASKPNKRLTRIRTLDTIEKIQLNLLGEEDKSTEIEVLRRELGMVEFSQEIERVAHEMQEAKKRHEVAIQKLASKLEALEETYPSRILIVEDSGQATLDLWKDFLEKHDLTGVKVLSSEGCTTNKIEEHLLQLRKNRQSYTPKVFRQIDRDGLLDSQISHIENQLNKVVGNKFPYRFRVLPVNEIENFAILDRDLQEIKEQYEEDIRNTFDKAAEAKLVELQHKYQNSAPKDMFRSSSSYTPVMQKMRGEAILDWNRYMPGKAISKKISNFNAIKAISSLDTIDHPMELKDYLNSIKQFFEGED